MKHILKHHHKSLSFFCISTVLFALLWVLTAFKVQWLISFDHGLNALMPALHSVISNPFFFYISEVFEPKIFIVWFSILLLLLAYKKKYFEAGFLFFGVAGGQVIKTIVKHLTEKPRPENIFGIIDGETSFPSGHATTSVFIFIALYYFLMPTMAKMQKHSRILLQANLIFGMLVIPFSRLFLQVHYVSDVIAGVLLGTASFAFTLFIFDYFYKKTHNDYAGALEK